MSMDIAATVASAPACRVGSKSSGIAGLKKKQQMRWSTEGAPFTSNTRNCKVAEYPDGYRFQHSLSSPSGMNIRLFFGPRFTLVLGPHIHRERR